MAIDGYPTIASLKNAALMQKNAAAVRLFSSMLAINDKSPPVENACADFFSTRKLGQTSRRDWSAVG